MKKNCTEGLLDEKHIFLDESTRKITLTIWIYWIKSYMRHNGIYTVFHVYDTYLKTEVYLLNDWGVSEYGKVSKWVQNPTNTGVGDGKVNCLPICNFDFKNLAWSGKSVLAPITLEIWETIKNN